MKNLIPALICLFLAIPSQAEIIIVDANGSGDFETIQAAIDDANDDDTVIVYEGIYTGSGNRDIDFYGLAITVRSLDPCDTSVVAATVIDCQASPSDLHRGFKFHRGEGPNSVLSGLTIKNGYGPKEEVYKGQFLSDGGAIFCKNASPTISYCLITENSSISHNSNGGGGGIFCRNSNATISNCTFKNNSAEQTLLDITSMLQIAVANFSRLVFISALIIAV